MTTLTTVKLYGDLGDTFGKEFQFGIKTPAQAIRVLQANFRGFGKYLLDHSKPGYHIYVGQQTIAESELNYPVSSRDVIKIVPVIAGSSDNPAVNIVLGTALVVLAPWALVANVGWSLILSGITQALFTPPEPDAPAESPENKPSYLFNGAVNTIKQGNPVPVGYGRLRVGSQVISASIETNEEVS